MPVALIEDMFDEPDQSEKNALPATDLEVLILSEKLLEFEVPTKVFLQAIAISAYDCASAFRYADNYLTTLKNKNKPANLLMQCYATNFVNN